MLPAPLDVSAAPVGRACDTRGTSWAPNGMLSALQHGALRCLLQTGHLQALLRQVGGCPGWWLASQAVLLLRVLVWCNCSYGFLPADRHPPGAGSCQVGGVHQSP